MKKLAVLHSGKFTPRQSETLHVNAKHIGFMVHDTSTPSILNINGVDMELNPDTGALEFGEFESNQPFTIISNANNLQQIIYYYFSEEE